MAAMEISAPVRDTDAGQALALPDGA